MLEDKLLGAEIIFLKLCEIPLYISFDTFFNKVRNQALRNYLSNVSGEGKENEKRKFRGKIFTAPWP